MSSISFEKSITLLRGNIIQPTKNSAPIMTIFKSINEIKKLFPNPRSCVDHYIHQKYGGAIKCPECNSDHVHNNCVHSLYMKSSIFTCDNCNNKFSIFKDTVFEKSNIDLRVWLLAIDRFLEYGKTLSPYKVQRELGVLDYNRATKVAECMNTIRPESIEAQDLKKLLDISYLQEIAH